MTNSDLDGLYAETKNQITSPNKVLILVLISELRKARSEIETWKLVCRRQLIEPKRLQSAEEALKLYADEIFYDHPNYLLMSNPPITPNWIMKDRGDKARAHFEKYQ